MSTIDPRLFALVYQPGASYDRSVPISLQPLQAHRNYIASLASQKILRQGGPFGDDVHGSPVIAVKAQPGLSARDLATRIANSDPAVTSSLLQVEVLDWHPRYGAPAPFDQGS